MSDLRQAAQLALEFVTSEAWGKTPYMDVCVYEDAARLRDALRAALAQEQKQVDPVQVHPSQFIQLIKGKEDMIGVPVYWAEWPSKETT